MLKIKKIIEYLFYLYIFILPWQTIFIFEEKFLASYKNQYATIGIYFSEIILWIIIISFIILLFSKIKQDKNKTFVWDDGRRMVLALLIFLLYSFASIFWSIDKDVALKTGLFFLEASILFFILFSQIIDYKNILKVIIASSFFPSVLAIYSFLSQSFFSSKFLGLTQYFSFVPGTSILYLENLARLTRAYGSFPHPNFFAGFLLITLLASFLFFEKTKSRLFIFSLICLQLMALLFTFSRSAWLSFFVLFLFIILFFLKEKKQFWQENKFYFYFIIIFVFSLFLIFKTIILSRVDNNLISVSRSTNERIELIWESKKIISDNMFFGVGAGNYTLASYKLNPSKDPWLYQPVHNIFLLFLSELGLAGFLFLGTAFLFFLYFYQKIAYFKYQSGFFLIFLVIFLLDHYFFTMYSGIILFTIGFYLFFDISSGNPLFFPKKEKKA